MHYCYSRLIREACGNLDLFLESIVRLETVTVVSIYPFSQNLCYGTFLNTQKTAFYYWNGFLLPAGKSVLLFVLMNYFGEMPRTNLPSPARAVSPFHYYLESFFCPRTAKGKWTDTFRVEGFLGVGKKACGQKNSTPHHYLCTAIIITHAK